jgi:hypothetical protein
MRKVCVFLSLVALAVAVAVPAGAQTNSKNIARIYNIKAKPGEAQQLEAGMKKMGAWGHQQNLQPPYIWSVISGERVGEYVLGWFGHDWADFDEMQARGEKAGVDKMIAENLVPYTESVKISFYSFLPRLSSPITPGQPPMPMSEVMFFTLKPGGMEPVMDAIKQVNAAIAKTHWKGNGPAGWYALMDGSEGPQLVLSIGHENWAGMQAPSPSLDEMLEQAYGKAGAHALEHEFNSHVRGEYSEIIRYRPDLSYNPSAQ